jgi:hypothetical protein
MSMIPTLTLLVLLASTVGAPTYGSSWTADTQLEPGSPEKPARLHAQYSIGTSQIHVIFIETFGFCVHFAAPFEFDKALAFFRAWLKGREQPS